MIMEMRRRTERKLVVHDLSSRMVIFVGMETKGSESNSDRLILRELRNSAGKYLHASNYLLITS